MERFAGNILKYIVALNIFLFGARAYALYGVDKPMFVLNIVIIIMLIIAFLLLHFSNRRNKDGR